MAFKLINATEVKTGSSIMVEEEPCIVKSMTTSRPGRHGHAKVRIEATSIFSDKKKVVAVPGHERFEVPLINKARGQILSVSENKANVMDLESFETLDMQIDKSVEGLKEEDNVEYWEVDGKKIIKRKI